jgi:hypothetical protein
VASELGLTGPGSAFDLRAIARQVLTFSQLSTATAIAAAMLGDPPAWSACGIILP